MSWRSATNSTLRRELRVDRELVGDGEHESEHVAAVGAGVLVVRLDDVAEQEGGAAVRVRELERLVDPPLPLQRRDADHGEQRQRQQQRRLPMLRADGGEQREGGQDEVDRERPRERRHELSGTDSERRPFARRRRDEVECELRRHGGTEDEQRARLRARRWASRRSRRRERGRARTRSCPARRARAPAAGSRARTRGARRAGRPRRPRAGPATGGRTNSISTKTSCVATAAPLPTSNTSREANANATTSTRMTHAAGWR